MNEKQVEFGLFIARLVLGSIMLIHGIQKWMNLDMVTGMFQDMMGLPGALAIVVAIVETVAGLSLILGLFVKLSSALLGLIMIGAMVTVKIPMVGFFGNGEMAGWEFDVSLLALSIVLTLSGSRLMAITTQQNRDVNKHTNV
ncbi:DoxX family protein [Pontibacillus salicampi]|uniref:DoxX family protein n=1 Tax=Pontibacillus salicampi TaxID=1449801 RepID=A0ABV6LLT9_9BACI